jgi:hypothetical protein
MSRSRRPSKVPTATSRGEGFIVSDGKSVRKKNNGVQIRVSNPLAARIRRGNFAIFAAIRRASSLVSTLARERKLIEMPSHLSEPMRRHS